jgi:hypothetical protein
MKTQSRDAGVRLVSLCRTGHLEATASATPPLVREVVMPLNLQHKGLGDVHERVLRANAVTPQLVLDVLAAAGVDGATLGVDRVRCLIAAQGWTDVAMALVEHVLPRWTIARLVLDEGEWHCALTKHWQVPDWLDDAIETRHHALPLAILAAFIEAREADTQPAARIRPAVPRPTALESSAPLALCCENFA